MSLIPYIGKIRFPLYCCAVPLDARLTFAVFKRGWTRQNITIPYRGKKEKNVGEK